jgi:hypothetical protein
VDIRCLLGAREVMGRDKKTTTTTRPPDSTTTDQLIPDKLAKITLGSDGLISIRGIDGIEYVLMMDGKYVPIDLSIGRGGALEFTRDSEGLWIIPISLPNGMSREQWDAVRREMSDENEATKKRKEVPIPIPPTKPIDKKKKDEPEPPMPPEDPDPRKKPPPVPTTTPIVKTDITNKNRTGGIAALRPFFSTYSGIDLLTQTDKEAIQDIKEYDLYDLPIPENDTMDNPLFMHNLRAKMFRFSGSADPSNAFNYSTVEKIITREILSTNREGSIQMDRTRETMYYNVGMPTQNTVDMENPRNTPTILGGSKDGVPWFDPDANDYSRGLGEANRTSANYTESIVDSLYKNPDIYNSLATINNSFK